MSATTIETVAGPYYTTTIDATTIHAIAELNRTGGIGGSECFIEIESDNCAQTIWSIKRERAMTDAEIRLIEALNPSGGM